MDDISMELTDVVVDRAVVGGLFSGRFVVRNTGPEFVIPLEVTSPVWDLTIHDMNETLIFSRRGGWGPITRDGAELTFDWSSSRNNNGDPNQPIIVTRIDRFRITIVISYPGLERERDRYQMFFESEPPSPQ